MDVVPAERQVEARRNGVLFLDRVQVARASRPRQRESNEGPAPRRHGRHEGHAVRREAHDLRWLQGHGEQLIKKEITCNTCCCAASTKSGGKASRMRSAPASCRTTANGCAA